MSVVHVLKLVIETQSPMAIHSGQRETGFDNAIVRDINGLPMIPATAMAGVWSHLVESEMGLAARQTWFGLVGEESRASRFSLSNAVIHDANNQVVMPFANVDDIEQDTVLQICALERPHHRERVSINDRGVAKETGKFDQLVLPKGVRFSLSIRWSAEHTDLTEVQPLLALWLDRQMAFGASTRNGLGQISVVASQLNTFDLALGAMQGLALSKFAHPSVIPTGNVLAQWATPNRTLLAQLPLKALDNWRCGSGMTLLSNREPENRVAILTYSEQAWSWTGNKAQYQSAQPVLCGSSIKGILAHRVAYHYRRRTQQWAETLGDAENSVWEAKPEGLKALFGDASDEHAESLAGILMIDDSPLEYQHTVIRQHNSIDRFTGGVRKGALYSEELLYQPQFTVNIWLKQSKSLEPALFEALLDTLNDLKLGLLPMGAGSGRGTSIVMADPSKPWYVDDSKLRCDTEELNA